MQTEVNALSEVDYALDVRASADELEPRIVDQLKKQQRGMNLKGFRPGKVPINVVRKLAGPQVAIGVVEEIIGEAYREAVGETETYDVLGQPRLANLDYDPQKGGDLHAVVRFGVRPQFDLAEMEGVPVTKFVRTFTDEDVEADLQRRLDTAAQLEPTEEDAVLTENDVAIVDIQPMSAEGEPTGPVQRGAQLVMADTSLRDELRAAILGRSVSPEPVRVELAHQHGDDDEHAHDHDDHTDRFDFTLTEIRRRVLPPLDAAFVQAQTGGRTEDVEELRADIRRELERSWERRATESLEAKMVEEFVDAHAFPVPYTLVEAVLDQRLDDLRERGQGQLPAGFDVEGYRERLRESAERQVRWLLVKERLVETEGLDVTDEDLDAEFARLAGDEMEPAVVRQFFSRQPGQLDQITDHLLNRRVFESLGRRFQVIEKSREDLERERAENPVALTAGEPDDEGQEADDAEGGDAEGGEDKPKKRGLFGFGRKKEE